jgi:hypothetical protein
LVIPTRLGDPVRLDFDGNCSEFKNCRWVCFLIFKELRFQTSKRTAREGLKTLLRLFENT